MEIIHPFALPVFIFQLFDFMREARAEQRMVFQNRHHVVHIGFSVEQTNHIGVAPQARFARQRLKYWRIVGILKSDRNGTRFHQRIAKIFRVRAGSVQFQLDQGMAKLFIYQ